MRHKYLFQLLTVLALSTVAVMGVASLRHSPIAITAQASDTPGSLQVLDPTGKSRGSCPLKHTDVKAEISGFLSRVIVTQEFQNPFKEKIEAVYRFPLPHNAAVDDMTMVVGDRTVRGKILRREEAQAVYEAARSNGQVASLLDQERPNIFTQSVANIMPGEQVKITISYVETLKYEDGAYEFVFPMVVAPRYIPGTPNGAQGNGFASDTDRVPDGSRITPPPAPVGMRAGHDISLDVTLDAGVPIDGLTSKSHEIDTERADGHRAHVRLKNSAEIPNKDFILRYDVAGKSIADAVMLHRSAQGGFFTMMLQPPERVTAADVTPRELVFVLDTSGSMDGFPIEKAKETMKLALDNLYPYDTFNLITFAGDTHILFPEPVPASKENLLKAQQFLDSRSGSGGTEMMTAIKAALDASDAQGHVRIVCFMTDGEVGNDMEIIGEVQKHPNARVFAFGIGSSINRFLLDGMARHGRGEVEYVGLQDDGSAAARRFYERVRSPLLTDISVDWNGLPVADVYPKQIPDLFSAKAVVLTGRFTASGHGVVRLKGKLAGRDFVREIPVDFPDAQPQHDVLATLWARTRVDDLMSQDFNGIQRNHTQPELKEAITQLGLEYRLMTQFTSFVAVEEMVVTDGGAPRRVDVPVELPDGMSRAVVLGDEEADEKAYSTLPSTTPMRRMPMAGVAANAPAVPAHKVIGESVATSRGQIRASSGGGTVPISGGVLNGKAINLPAPAYPQLARSAHVRGSVTVQVVIDETGKVVSAKPISGHPLLQAAAATAASAASFAPTKLAGKSVRVTGVITYNFRLGSRAPATSASRLSNVELSPEELRSQELFLKLHPALGDLLRRLQAKGTQPGAAEAGFVHNGKMEVQVWLTDKSDANLAELEKLGFEVVLDPKSAKLVIGRLPLEKLEALAGLTFVRYVAPQLSGK